MIRISVVLLLFACSNFLLAASNEWRLPAGHYMPAKMPMHFVHPRDAESASWAYAKNAHPGVAWEIPIVIQGGAWPFKYDIVDNGGATGLEIGGELKRAKDGKYVRHQVYDKYGVLSWEKPVTGTYAIKVRVTDQDGKNMNVPISLTVGTQGWIFIDAQNGDDAHDGTHDKPFKSFARLHKDKKDAPEFAQHRVYIKGLVRMDGCDERKNNVSIKPESMPKVYVGYPNSDAVLEVYEGKTHISSADFYLANMEYRHAKDHFQDNGKTIHMFMAWQAERLVLHDVHFSRFQGKAKNENYGNSSIIMFIKNEGNPNVSVVNCVQSGVNGHMTSAYRLRHAVFEKNIIRDIDIQTTDGSTWNVYYMKVDNLHVSLRANTCYQGNKKFGPGVLGMLYAANVEFCYNTIFMESHPNHRRAAFNFFMSHGRDYPVDKIFVYRNSLKNAFRSKGQKMSGIVKGSCLHEQNVLDSGSMPEGDWITSRDNADGDTYFDHDMRLLKSKQGELLGKKGAEIAVPISQ